MKIAILCSNNYPVAEETKLGTHIFIRLFLEAFASFSDPSKYDMTVFAAGSSRVRLPLRSVESGASIDDPAIAKRGKYIMFELALLSRAFAMQDEFDLYHVHIGDGDLVMPFVPFVRKPVLITLHHIYDEDFTRRYFDLFRRYPNVAFVAASDRQRVILPNVRYAATIPHGIESETLFSFNAMGGEGMMWAGRAMPEKGARIAVDAALRTGNPLSLFAISKPEYQNWIEQTIVKDAAVTDPKNRISISFDTPRSRLIAQYQSSKLFLFPIQWEEAFGLVFAESMSCGTPIVTFARGSAPEIVKDGITGFLVNPSDDDVRGNWIVKKTGINGLCEAIEKIYTLSTADYAAMRRACRARAEEHFSLKTMVRRYESTYETVAQTHSLL